MNKLVENGLQRDCAEDVMAHLPVGLVVADAALRVVSVNQAFRKIFHMKHDHGVAGLDLDSVLPHKELRAQAQCVIEEGAARHGIGIAVGDKRLRVALAGMRCAEEERRLLVVVEDVTEEQRLRDEARLHALRYRDQASLLDKATDAIVVRGIDFKVHFWNKSAERLYGWTSQEVMGRSVLDLLYDDPELVVELSNRLLEQNEWRGELLHRRKDGSTFAVESHWTLVRDEEHHQAQSVFVINTDITQRKVTEAKIQHLGLYDMLTGLPNRTLFTDRLQQALARAKRQGRGLALLFMDLNRFKEINDTRGHGVGDQVLVKVAKRFRAALRGEEMLARLAGDEFVVVSEAVDKAAGSRIAARLQQALAEPLVTSAGTFSVGVSIGIACYPEDAATGEDLLKCADIAMYRVKATGGGHVCYQPEMSAGLAERMELAKDLQRALSDGKLELYYQPKFNLGTGCLTGAEALLRWRDPERGWVSPAKFIPIAEARGMIGALGTWVLREACRQMKAWRNAGLVFPGRLAVNLAARQLDESDIAESIQAIVRAEGLTPACFELELTESTLMNNVERAIEIIGTLKTAGFALSIDDFGTGYSSLSYLKRLPVDKLKIDISFVRDMLDDRLSDTIVTTIIGMARNLGLQVIAEGVEVAAQAEALRLRDCDEAQGYYFGHPEHPAAFAKKWLQSGMLPELSAA